MRLAVLMVLVGVGLASAAQAAPCDPERRLLLGGLKCDAPSANSWYQLEVYYGCTPLKGKRQGVEPVLEVKERRPDLYETRATMRLSEVEPFIKRSVLKGNRNPPLFTTVLEGGRGEVVEVCGEETRTSVFKKTCGEGDHALSVELDVMCRRTLGLPVPHVVITDTTRGKPKQLRALSSQDLLSRGTSHRGKPRGSLWKSKMGRGGEVELEGLFKPNSPFFEYMDLKLTPRVGEPCSDLIHVFALWSLKWPPKPRFGFLEAAAVKPLGTNVFSQLHLIIAPLEDAPCEKVLDISEAWNRRWE